VAAVDLAGRLAAGSTMSYFLMVSLDMRQLASLGLGLTLLAAILADLGLRALFDHVTLLTAAAASHRRCIGALPRHVAHLVAVAALHRRLIGAILSHVTGLVASTTDHAIHGTRVGAVSFVVSVHSIPVRLYFIACRVRESPTQSDHS
jgi:hypothetical protein